MVPSILRIGSTCRVMLKHTCLLCAIVNTTCLRIERTRPLPWRATKLGTKTQQ